MLIDIFQHGVPLELIVSDQLWREVYNYVIALGPTQPDGLPLPL